MKRVLSLTIVSLLFFTVTGGTMSSKNMVNVKDFGAIVDGLFLDTRYIQN